MENKFSKAYILGSGELPYMVAQICREYTENITVIEIKLSDGSFLEKKCSSESIDYMALSKDEITSLLLAEADESLIISASSTYLVPKCIIEKSNFFIINWHNALLPAHKGRNAECWAIFEGDSLSGITWHMLSGDVDGGDILLQKKIPITESTTALSLFKEQTEAGRDTFKEMAHNLFKKDIKTFPQGVATKNQMHYSKDVPNNGILNLNWDYDKTSCFLRSMDYGALKLMGSPKVIIDGETYKFRKYELILNYEEYIAQAKSDNLIDIALDSSGFIGTDYLLIKGSKAILLKRLKREE